MERAFGLEIPTTLEEVCRPDRLALIVYDMQAGIVVQLPDGDAITRFELRDGNDFAYWKFTPPVAS